MFLNWKKEPFVFSPSISCVCSLCSKLSCFLLSLEFCEGFLFSSHLRSDLSWLLSLNAILRLSVDRMIEKSWKFQFFPQFLMLLEGWNSDWLASFPSMIYIDRWILGFILLLVAGVLDSGKGAQRRGYCCSIPVLMVFDYFLCALVIVGYKRRGQTREFC